MGVPPPTAKHHVYNEDTTITGGVFRSRERDVRLFTAWE